MMKDVIINSWCRKLAFRVLPFVFEKDSVPKMLDKSTMSISRYRWATVQLIIALCLTITAFTFILDILIYQVFLMLKMNTVANFSLWFLLSLPSMLAFLMSLKLQAIQSFYKKHDESVEMPEKYFYKACDVDLLFALGAAIIVGIIAVNLG